jgi:hypothetical protein
MRHSLPVIANDRDIVDRIEIPLPCHVPWADMTGDDRVRFCGDCRQSVYNVALFTRAEATRLLNDSSGRVCLRIFRRPDGTVVTDDCRARLRAARKRGLLIFAGTLLVVFWAQICAQFVGLMGLRRVMSSGGTMGDAPAMPMAGAPAPMPPPPAIELSGAPVRVLEVKGEVPRAIVGGIKPAPPETMGRRSVKGKIVVKKPSKVVIKTDDPTF